MDVGEATDAAGVEVERALLGLVTTANVACGGHAGDEETMEATVAAALAHSVRIGAHPSYPDRAGFGREPMDIDRGRRCASRCRRNCGISTASALTPARPSSPSRPTARCYEEVGKGGAIYETFRDAVRDSFGDRVSLVLPSGCHAVAMVLRDGMTASEEGFCDRAYRRDGGLVDRHAAGAVLDDPEVAAAQALSLARGAVAASDGSVLTLWVDTLCTHSDTPRAVDIATAVRSVLAGAGIDVRAPIPA